MITIGTLSNCNNSEEETLAFCKEMHEVITRVVDSETFIGGAVNYSECDVQVQMPMDRVGTPSLCIYVNENDKIYCHANIDEDSLLLEVEGTECTVLLHSVCGETVSTTSNRDIEMVEDMDECSEEYTEILDDRSTYQLAKFFF